jgi:hypothetical protein
VNERRRDRNRTRATRGEEIMSHDAYVQSDPFVLRANGPSFAPDLESAWFDAPRRSSRPPTSIAPSACPAVAPPLGRAVPTAAHLIEDVLPVGVPLRQWVLTVPFAWRKRLG